jgi:hypothetical protein
VIVIEVQSFFNNFSLCVGFWKNCGHCRYNLDTLFLLFQSVVPFV